jgi:hypothetical protein
VRNSCRKKIEKLQADQKYIIGDKEEVIEN